MSYVYLHYPGDGVTESLGSVTNEPTIDAALGVAELEVGSGETEIEPAGALAEIDQEQGNVELDPTTGQAVIE